MRTKKTKWKFKFYEFNVDLRIMWSLSLLFRAVEFPSKSKIYLLFLC